MAALAIRPHVGASVKGVVFEIPTDELEAYKEREHRYHAIQVLVDDHCPCWTVVEQTDDAYRANMAGSAAEWEHRIGQYYSDGPLWGRNDILPLRKYLTDVVLAAHTCGDASWLSNLLDGCLLADGITTVRAYVQATGAERFPSLIPLLASASSATSDVPAPVALPHHQTTDCTLVAPQRNADGTFEYSIHACPAAVRRILSMVFPDQQLSDQTKIICTIQKTQHDILQSTL
jgi:hypothetical protein